MNNDITFSSQVLIIIAIYLLSKYIYNKTDWHISAKKVWENPIAQKVDKFLTRFIKIRLDEILNYTIAIIWGLPAFITAALIGISSIKGIFNRLESANYWEPILFWIGLISLYFMYLISIDEKKLKKKINDSIIAEKNRTIEELERKINLIEKGLKN